MKTSAYSQAQPGKAGAGKYAEIIPPFRAAKTRIFLSTDNSWDERQVATRTLLRAPIIAGKHDGEADEQDDSQHRKQPEPPRPVRHGGLPGLYADQQDSELGEQAHGLR